METLRAYLNSLPANKQAEYAINCGTTIGYLRKAISINSRLDGALCRRLDENSNGIVSRSSLRSDIWPELARDSVTEHRKASDRRSNRRKAKSST